MNAQTSAQSRAASADVFADPAAAGIPGDAFPPAPGEANATLAFAPCAACAAGV